MFFTLGLVPSFIRYAFQPGSCTRLTGWLPPKCGVDRVDETRHFLFIQKKNIHLVQILTCACTLHQGVPRGWRDTRERKSRQNLITIVHVYSSGDIIIRNSSFKGCSNISLLILEQANMYNILNQQSVQSSM